MPPRKRRETWFAVTASRWPGRSGSGASPTSVTRPSRTSSVRSGGSRPAGCPVSSWRPAAPSADRPSSWDRQASRPPAARAYDVFGMIPPPSEADGADIHARYQTVVQGRITGYRRKRQVLRVRGRPARQGGEHAPILRPGPGCVSHRAGSRGCSRIRYGSTAGRVGAHRRRLVRVGEDLPRADRAAPVTRGCSGDRRLWPLVGVPQGGGRVLRGQARPI